MTVPANPNVEGQVTYPDGGVTADDYAVAIGLGTDLDGLMGELCARPLRTWTSEYDPLTALQFFRGKFGKV